MTRTEEKDEEASKELTPWEQHSTVISIPRFDYKATSSLLEHCHSGFLITCTIKREKSATKEAISILQKHISLSSTDGVELFEPADENVSIKRRKICSDETDGINVRGATCEEGADASGTSGEMAKDVPLPKTDADVVGLELSLVKLTRSGLLLFTFPKNKSLHTAKILANIFESLDSGSIKPPVWCHRILPLQATCILKEKDLQMTVSKLVQEYLNDERNKHGSPMRFAVGYNRRGIDETEMKVQKNISKESHEVILLDRSKCFSIVAEAVKGVAADSIVDLKSPELAVLVELLPLSGLPNRSSVAALSILPQNLLTVKPRLCVKALASDTKARGGRNKKH